MSAMHLLVKDYGREGFTVHGVTVSDDVAQAWECADAACKRIEIDQDASISQDGLLFAEEL